MRAARSSRFSAMGPKLRTAHASTDAGSTVVSPDERAASHAARASGLYDEPHPFRNGVSGPAATRKLARWRASHHASKSDSSFEGMFRSLIAQSPVQHIPTASPRADTPL